MAVVGSRLLHKRLVVSLSQLMLRSAPGFVFTVEIARLLVAI
jgi:hypothetical protein